MTGIPADKVAKLVGMLEAGAKVAVADERKFGEKVIAEGIIRDISFQEEAAYIYLNTGYYVVVLPAILTAPQIHIAQVKEQRTAF